MRTAGRFVALAAVVALAACSLPTLREGGRRLSLLHDAPPSWLPVPVAGVTAAKLSDSFGDPRSGGRVHEGIGIFAPRGTPVGSATPGIVIQRGELGLGGRVVSVLGPGGYRHYYAHLDDWAAPRQGDWVEAGEVIGYVGDSGNAAGGAPHLHYGVYAPGGGAMNPYSLLVAPRPAPAAAVAAGS